MTSANSMHEAGHSKPVLWDNPEGWGGEEGGESSKGKATSNIQGKTHTINTDLLAETLQARGTGRIYLKY